MASIYVSRAGSHLRIRGDRIRVEHESDCLLDLPLRRVDSVVCMGPVQASHAVFTRLLRQGADFAFLSRRGDLHGRLVSRFSKNIYLRLRQYETALHDASSLILARTFVCAKLGNARNLLRKYYYNHRSPGLEAAIRKLEKVEKLASGATDIGRLLGLEGVGARLYFAEWDRMLRCDLRFERRSIRPPKNEINALLSLTYTLVGNELEATVASLGFDPQMGFLHSPSYGRASLALDLLEEFRPALCDPFVLRLVNLRMLEKDDFEHETEGGGFRLSDRGRKTYFTEYERRMQREVLHAGMGRKCSYRQLLRHQAEALARALLRGHAYVPYRTVV
ncbi:CRISPR-associated endonuclease Cas1 [bacterium]|nr:CRISPR-associated endonuclease Cas1 [bacterium]